MKIPETLDHLMYCLTKEILCKQPDNVYEFSMKFFHQLVEERDGRKYQKLSTSLPLKCRLPCVRMQNFPATLFNVYCMCLEYFFARVSYLTHVKTLDEMFP